MAYDETVKELNEQMISFAETVAIADGRRAACIIRIDSRLKYCPVAADLVERLSISTAAGGAVFELELPPTMLEPEEIVIVLAEALRHRYGADVADTRLVYPKKRRA